MQISWNSCIQRNRLTQQRTNSYTTFGATGGFGSSGERSKSRCNRGVDQVHISRSGADQTIRCRSGRGCGASVRKQTMCGTSGICHYIQTVSNSRKLFPRQTPTLIVIINQSLMDKRRTVQRIYFLSIRDRSKMNYEQLHWLFPILMASDRFEKDNIKDA